MTETEIWRLKELLAAREGKPGYKANVKVIKERIAGLEEELGRKLDTLGADGAK